MKTNRILPVEWVSADAEAVPVVLVTGLELLAVDRLLQFVRNNPNAARHSAANDLWRGKPALLIK